MMRFHDYGPRRMLDAGRNPFGKRGSQPFKPVIAIP